MSVPNMGCAENLQEIEKKGKVGIIDIRLITRLINGKKKRKMSEPDSLS